LAKWALTNQDKVRRLSRRDEAALSASWEDLVDAAGMDEMREQFLANEAVGFEVPVVVRPKAGDREQSFFRVYLRQKENIKESMAAYVRQGLTVTEVQGPAAAGLVALTVIENPPLARLLRAAENPAHKVQSARNTLIDTLMARVPADLQQETAVMLAEGRFLDVAKRLRNPEGSAMGEIAVGAPASVAESTQVQASRRLFGPNINATRVLELTADGGRSATSPTVATFRSLARTKAVRTLLAGVGIVAVGYLVFEAKFVGTASELVAIFFWGFTADVSVDALVGAIAQEKR
jgi:hypothetical protein